MYTLISMFLINYVHNPISRIGFQTEFSGNFLYMANTNFLFNPDNDRVNGKVDFKKAVNYPW